ncbi:MAG: RimK family alpha-L-glutamate ligase [Candidatus Woesearchaeota archaeon]
MKAAVISLGSKSSLWTVEALKKHFDQVDSINLKEIELNIGTPDMILYKGKKLPEYDCVYAKGSFKYAPLLRAVTQELSKKSYMPIGADAFTTVHDKFLTHLVLQDGGIPMPKTHLASSVDASRSLLDKVRYPIILKLLQGTQGKGVLFAESKAAASSILDTLTSLNQPVIIQEYIDTGGMDTRVIVCGNKVVGSMVRRAKPDEERANIHSGGKGEAVKISDSVSKIAIKAAKVLKMDIGAVDILEGAKGPVVIEANLSPGLQGIMEATGDDIAAHIAQYLFDKTVEFKQDSEGESAEKLFGDMGISIDQSAESGKPQNIITHLSMRGEKIILPSIVNRIARLTEDDECTITIEKGKVNIEKNE